jgi:hypothetical protein
MNKNYLYIALVFIAVIFLAMSTTKPLVTSIPEASAPAVSRGNCLADDCLLVDDLDYPVSKLPSDVKAALDSALDDEYKAYSTYQAIITKLGSSSPFSMIIGAEEQHIASLKTIYTKYGETPVTNKYLGKITSPATLALACSAGVEAEISNGNLYKEKLLPLVSAYPDITQVFTSLMDASIEKHLPAFERCASR